MTTNRAKLARVRAGLSVGQACKMLALDRETLIHIEEVDSAFICATAARDAMAEIYAVDPAWLAGDAPRHDYARVDAMRGAENLSPHDRDTLAEFTASMPRSPNKTLAQIADEKSKRDE